MPDGPWQTSNILSMI